MGAAVSPEQLLSDASSSSHFSPALVWVLPMGLQSFRVNLLQPGLSMGHSFFREHPPAPVWGPLQAALWYLLHSGAPPSPPSLTLMLKGLFHHTFFLTAHTPGSVLHFLKHVLTEVPPAWLMCSAVPRGGSVVPMFSMGHSLVSSHRGHPCSPPMNKTPTSIYTYILDSK